jgi:hypothetical protein
MRWKLVLGIGVVAATALLVAALVAIRPYAEGPASPRPWYLGWAALAAAGLALALAGLVRAVDARPRRPRAIAGAVVGIGCAVALFGVGEASVYVAAHSAPAVGSDRGAELLLAGLVAVAALGGGSAAAVHRRG